MIIGVSTMLIKMAEPNFISFNIWKIIDLGRIRTIYPSPKIWITKLAVYNNPHNWKLDCKNLSLYVFCPEVEKVIVKYNMWHIKRTIMSLDGNILYIVIFDYSSEMNPQRNRGRQSANCWTFRLWVQKSMLYSWLHNGVAHG